jgi:hypothetical protein
MPGTGGSRRLLDRQGSHPALKWVGLLTGLLGLCVVAGCLLIGWQVEGRAELEEVGGKQVYSRLQEMNKQLQNENRRLHSLLQEDETANMHVEAGLQVCERAFALSSLRALKFMCIMTKTL